MLKTGEIAPGFELPRFDGREAGIAPRTAHKRGLLAFYKFSCPTCQLTLPFVQKLFEEYGRAAFIAAIAQDGPEETADFREQLGLTLPTYLDLPPYSVSRTYGITVVPSLFFFDQNGRIQYAGEGFARRDFTDLVRLLASGDGRSVIDLFGNAPVPELRPG